MTTVETALQHSPIVYVTRDIERALGLPLHTPGYFIISNFTPFAKRLAQGRTNVLLIESEALLDTPDLLTHEKAIVFLKTLKNPSILVFKNTILAERACQEHGWKLLNPPAALAASIEEKITQLSFLPEIRSLFPAYDVRTCKDIIWRNEPFVLQFNHSHTGSGTVLIDSEQTLQNIQTQFPNRDARCAPYITGPLLTNNNVVAPQATLIGNISYQITGLQPFTDRPFATIGNDWALPTRLLSAEQLRDYRTIAERVGGALRERGWKGLFGIDVILEEATGRLHLLEINARQPASTALEAELQQKTSPKGITIFEAHLASLMDLNSTENNLILINDGAQIILRHTPRLAHASIETVSADLTRQGYTVIAYENIKPESDVLRIQSTHGLMAEHNEFNDDGKNILRTL